MCPEMRIAMLSQIPSLWDRLPAEYPYSPPDVKRQQPWMTRNFKLPPTHRWMTPNFLNSSTLTFIARRYYILRASRRTDYAESDPR
jgi:hypothetical protein